jgi:hypothetical protein
MVYLQRCDLSVLRSQFSQKNEGGRAHRSRRPNGAHLSALGKLASQERAVKHVWTKAVHVFQLHTREQISQVYEGAGQNAADSHW